MRWTKTDEDFKCDDEIDTGDGLEENDFIRGLTKEV